MGAELHCGHTAGRKDRSFLASMEVIAPLGKLRHGLVVSFEGFVKAPREASCSHKIEASRSDQLS